MIGIDVKKELKKNSANAVAVVVVAVASSVEVLHVEGFSNEIKNNQAYCLVKLLHCFSQLNQ